MLILRELARCGAAAAANFVTIEGLTFTMEGDLRAKPWTAMLEHTASTMSSSEEKGDRVMVGGSRMNE
jgi:hypothetical protein